MERQIGKIPYKKDIFTAYGVLKSVTNAEYYPSGSLKSAMVQEESILETPYGRLIPNYSGADCRKKYREAVSFFENGGLKSIYLQSPQPIGTEAGRIDAELLTFYPNGSIKRLFPLYGQIGGYWTEEDEYGLAKKVELTLLNQIFDTAPLCIAFYPSGSVKSLTVWSQETVSVNTAYGPVKSRFGFELSEDGRLKSIEPAFGVSLATEYGILYPYDSENYRLHAEGNSLSFDEHGRLLSAKTLKNKIRIEENKKEYFIQARKIEDPMTGMERPTSLELFFEDRYVRIEDMGGPRGRFEKNAVSFI